MAETIVTRGGIWHFALDPVAGSEQGKTRPCVVVQRDSANATSPTTIVCPLTGARNKRSTLLDVPVVPPEGGIGKPSMVSVNQVRVLDKGRVRGAMLGRLEVRTMALVDEGLRAILDLGDD